ncbi:hypothetical protein RJ639_025684 [Escallonia herrerae]|uniref:Retrotransposon gag domain-containing protein n=1 Tax=Escallonia herrerae TaxID=1293975 RepID=A0AA88UVX9_9ASTE|nr:hypothetical protein RJ639_025684 [Escallonia herrerae]
MAVAPPSTHNSHLDPGDLRLRLTSRSSYGRKYQSTADPTYNPKDKSGDHITRSGSCYRRDSSVEDSTNSSPAQGARVKTPQRSIHRKRTPESRSQERDSWKVVPRYYSPERSCPRNESGYPLSNAIEKAKLPPNFRMPQCDLYDGTGDPGEHVYQFQTNMLLLQVSDAVMCRAFPTTLRKAAHAWFKSLQPRSIYSFGQLSDLFQKHFVSNRSRRKNSASLLNIVQEKNESLACFLGRFNAATLEIDNLDESNTWRHKGRRGEGKEEQKKRSRELTPPQGGKPTKHSKYNERRPKEPFAWENLTPLNAKPSQILHEIKENKALQWPDKLKSRPNKRNEDFWCHFHKDHGHTTDNWGSLKRAIEALIKRGQLRKFVAPKEERQQTPPAMKEREDLENNADNESSAEILFHDAFKKMNIPTDRLRKMDTPLYGFSNHPVAAEGIIALPVAIGTPPAQANFILDFVVIKVPSAYNAILGQPALNQLQAVVSR